MTGDSQILGAVWPDEGPQYGGAVSAPGYLPMADALRLEKIRQARMLFDGRHREFYLDGGRSQFFYRKVRTPAGADRPLFATCNLLRLIATKSADLLFGGVPIFGSDSQEQAAAISELVERSALDAALHPSATEGAVDGESYLEAVIMDGQVCLMAVPADEICPIGSQLPDGHFRSYIRRTVEWIDGDGPRDGAPGNGTRQQILLEVTYAAGSIERHCYKVTQRDNGQPAKGEEVPLETWPAYMGMASELLEPVIPTGIQLSTITRIPNLLLRSRPYCDFDGGLVGMQDVVNAKNSQLAYVILRHTQPKLIVPEQLMDEDGKLTDQEVYTKRQGDPDAQYLTWEAQLDAAQKDRAFAVNQLLVQAETSPVLLGMKEGAAPDAYRKVRLEAFNSITKAARKSLYWTRGLKRALASACLLEQTLPGVWYPLGKISVQLRDGIPGDDLDEANRLATLKGAGIVDDEWCLEQLIPGNEAAVDEVLARLESKREAVTSSLYLQGEGAAAHGSPRMNTDQNPGAGDGSAAGDANITGE